MFPPTPSLGVEVLRDDRFQNIRLILSVVVPQSKVDVVSEPWHQTGVGDGDISRSLRMASDLGVPKCRVRENIPSI